MTLEEIISHLEEIEEYFMETDRWDAIKMLSGLIAELQELIEP